MSAIQIIYTFATVGIVYALAMFLISRYMKDKKVWLLVVGCLLLLPSFYIGFVLQAMHNKHFMLAGVQWGLFGGAFYALSSAWQKYRGNNA